MSGVAQFEMINYERRRHGSYSYRVPWKWDHEVRRFPPQPESPSDRFRRPRGHSVRTYKSFCIATGEMKINIGVKNLPKLISWGCVRGKCRKYLQKLRKLDENNI